jgi:hypothetical protein
MFKKILVCFLSLLLIFGIAIVNKKPIFSGYASNFEVYLGESSSNAKIVNASKIDFLFLNKVCGESFKIDSLDFNIDKFLVKQNAKLVFIEEIESGISIYAYSRTIKYKKRIKGKMVNLQIFIPKDIENTKITVGTPIIYGSF